jgi:hypothetical protein
MEQTVLFGSGTKHFLNGFVEICISLHGTLRSDYCWAVYALGRCRSMYLPYVEKFSTFSI